MSYDMSHVACPGLSARTIVRGGPIVLSQGVIESIGHDCWVIVALIEVIVWVKAVNPRKCCAAIIWYMGGKIKAQKKKNHQWYVRKVPSPNDHI